MTSREFRRLSLRVQRPDFTDPNARVLELVLDQGTDDEKVLSSVNIDIKEKPEYEG